MAEMKWTEDLVLMGGTAEERTEEFEDKFLTIVAQMMMHGISSGHLISLIEATQRERQEALDG